MEKNSTHMPTFILLGCPGVGKSQFINMLIGAKVAKTNPSNSGCTEEVNMYSASINGLDINLIDMPGFFKGDEEKFLDHTLKVKEILKNEKFDGFIFFITLYNSTTRSITKDFKLASHVMKHLSPYAINCDTKTFIVLKKWDMLMLCCEDQPEDLADIEETIEKIPIEYEKLLTGIEKWLKVEKGIFYKAVKRIPTVYKLGKKLDKFDGENLIKMMKTLIEKKNQIPKRSFSRFTIDHAIHNLSFDEGDLGSMENFNAGD